MPDKAIVLFDGVCNLCNASVNAIIRRDSRGYFRFAALQSEAGRALAQRFEMDATRLDTLVVIEHGSAYVESTAALRIARRLDGPSKLLYGLTLVPRPLRDGAYRRLARNRYGWFGRRDDECIVPTPDVHERFLSEAAP